MIDIPLQNLKSKVLCRLFTVLDQTWHFWVTYLITLWKPTSFSLVESCKQLDGRKVFLTKPALKKSCLVHHNLQWRSLDLRGHALFRMDPKMILTVTPLCLLEMIGNRWLYSHTFTCTFNLLLHPLLTHPLCKWVRGYLRGSCRPLKVI